MKIRETKIGTEFIFNNQFSKSMVSKNDRRLTNWLKLKYKLCHTFHLGKLLKNKRWFRSADYHWNQILNEPQDRQIELTKDEFQIKKLVVFDLLPKEYLDSFRRKYLQFRNTFKAESNLNILSVQLDKQLEVVHHPDDFWMDLEYFIIKEGTSLKKYFDDLHAEIVGLTESFCIIKYTLTVSTYAAELSEQITSQQVYKEAICWSKDSWWKKNSLAGFHGFNMKNEPKQRTVEDFILELKSVFFNEIRNVMFSKIYDWNLIPPSVTVMSSNKIEDNIQKVFELLHRPRSVEYSKSNQTTYFIPACQHVHNRYSNSLPHDSNSLLIIDSNCFKDENDDIALEEIEQQICSDFSSYFVLESLLSAITNSINIAERDISQTVYSKSKYRKLLKVKMKTDKSLYFYKRLLEELNEEKKFDKLQTEYISSYLETYENILQDRFPQKENIYAFCNLVKYIYYDCESILGRINKIYKHFDDNAKLIESRYNYKVIVGTFLATIASIIIALVAIAIDHWQDIECFFRNLTKG